MLSWGVRQPRKGGQRCSGGALRLLRFGRHQLAEGAALTDEDRAARFDRRPDQADDAFPVGVHQIDLGLGRACVRVVARAPVCHFQQDRDQIQPLVGQRIYFFALVRLRRCLGEDAFFL